MNAWKITKKDMLILVRDRRTLLGLLLLPLAVHHHSGALSRPVLLPRRRK